jgi:hypothetical protein
MTGRVQNFPAGHLSDSARFGNLMDATAEIVEEERTVYDQSQLEEAETHELNEQQVSRGEVLTL